MEIKYNNRSYYHFIEWLNETLKKYNLHLNKNPEFPSKEDAENFLILLEWKNNLKEIIIALINYKPRFNFDYNLITWDYEIIEKTKENLLKYKYINHNIWVFYNELPEWYSDYWEKQWISLWNNDDDDTRERVTVLKLKKISDLYKWSDWKYRIEKEENAWEIRCSFWDRSEWASVTIWIEIEKDERAEDELSAKLIMAEWWVDNDGSVDWWEYTTPILDIDKSLEYLKDFKWLYELETSSSCWWHIHLMDKSRTQDKLYDDVKHYKPLLIWLYPARARNSYCNAQNLETNKYSAIHKHYSWTLEFRIFPWVRNFRNLEFRINLLKFIVNNPTANKEEAIAKIWTIEFLTILNIAYRALDRKIEILERILRAYEIDDENLKEICELAKNECSKLNK